MKLLAFTSKWMYIPLHPPPPPLKKEKSQVEDKTILHSIWEPQLSKLFQSTSEYLIYVYLVSINENMFRTIWTKKMSTQLWSHSICIFSSLKKSLFFISCYISHDDSKRTYDWRCQKICLVVRIKEPMILLCNAFSCQVHAWHIFLFIMHFYVRYIQNAFYVRYIQNAFYVRYIQNAFLRKVHSKCIFM